MSTTGTTPTPDLDAIRGRRERAREAVEHPTVQFTGPAPLVAAALAAEVVAQRRRADAAEAERNRLRSALIDIADVLGYDLTDAERAEQDAEDWRGLRVRLEQDYAELHTGREDAEAGRAELAAQLRHHERFAEQMKAAAGTGMLLPPHAVRACVAELSAALTGKGED